MTTETRYLVALADGVFVAETEHGTFMVVESAWSAHFYRTKERATMTAKLPRWKDRGAHVVAAKLALDNQTESL